MNKNFNQIQRAAMMLLMMLLTTATAWAADDFVDNGNGSYTIMTADGWSQFASSVNGGTSYSGKTVKLDKDIEVSEMVGTIAHKFNGTFDGCGHTLTVSYGSAESPVAEDNVAPLRVVGSGCTITGLHVAGDIYTSAKYAGGLVGTQNGAVIIRDCHVSTVIHSRTSGDGSHGGLVGMNGDSDGSALAIEGCLFDGKLLTEGSTPTINCAGFVGAKDSSGTVAVTNSLYAPAQLGTGETEPSDGCATFVRNGSAGANCYYTCTLGATDNQGKQAHTVTTG